MSGEPLAGAGWSLRRAGTVHAAGEGARAVHARPPRAPARRVRGAGLAGPVGRGRATAAVARGLVRPVALSGAEGDAGGQTGFAAALPARRRTTSLRSI